MEKNKIYLGDAYELIKQIDDKTVDLIITDPPYEIEGIHDSGILKTRSTSFHKELKNTQLDVGIDLSILDEYVRVMKKINIYIWCNKAQIFEYYKYFVEKLGCNWEMLIWGKENPIAFCGTHYLCDKEYCLYFWEQGAYLYVPYDRGRTWFVSKTNRTDKNNFLHPTIKPIDLIEMMIQNSTDSNGGG